MISNFCDLLAEAKRKNIGLSKDFPMIFGYKSRWGLKLAIENPKKREKILEQANKFFCTLKCDNA